MNSETGYRLTITIALLGLVALYFLFKHSPPDFTQYAAGPERKQAFIEYLSPIVHAENAAVLNDGALARELELAVPDLGFYRQIKLERFLKKYRLKDFDPKE